MAEAKFALVGLVSVTISLFFGTVAGAAAGCYGGKLNNLIMHFMDLLLAFPSILLAIVIVAFLGASLCNAMIVIGVVRIPRYARIVRGSVLEEYGKDYVQAAGTLGAGDGRSGPDDSIGCAGFQPAGRRSPGRPRSQAA